MGSLTRYGLTLTVEGASLEELELGLRAALRVFDNADTSPQLAATAVWDLEGQDPAFWGSKRVIPLETKNRAATWVIAFDEAMSACCDGRLPPPGADLSLAD